MENEEIDLYEIFPRLHLKWTDEVSPPPPKKKGKTLEEKYASDISSLDDKTEVNKIINEQSDETKKE